MSRTKSQIKSAINSLLGKSAGTVSTTDFDAGMNLALDALQLEVDFPEGRKTALLSPAAFEDVTVYACPSDLRDDGIIDFRPFQEIGVYRDQEWQRNTVNEFDRNLLDERSRPRFAIEHNNGTRKLRLLTNLSSSAKSILLHNCNSYNGNGTWTADTTNSDALAVSTDTVNFVEGSGAVSFNVDVSQSGNNRATIYNADLASVDVSGLSSNPYLFLWVYIPDVTYVTSVSGIYGSDSSATPSTKANYYTFTATTQFGGTALVSGKNLIGVALSSATETGSVTEATIRYVEVILNYSASQTDMTGVKVDGIFLRDPEFFEIRYPTYNIVQAAGGTKKQYFTADDDTLLLNADGEVLYVNYTAGYLAPNVKSLGTGKTLGERAREMVALYKNRYPSERRLVQRNWY